MIPKHVTYSSCANGFWVNMGKVALSAFQHLRLFDQSVHMTAWTSKWQCKATDCSMCHALPALIFNKETDLVKWCEMLFWYVARNPTPSALSLCLHQFCKRLSISALNFSKLHIARAHTYAAATALTWYAFPARECISLAKQARLFLNWTFLFYEISFQWSHYGYDIKFQSKNRHWWDVPASTDVLESSDIVVFQFLNGFRAKTYWHAFFGMLWNQYLKHVKPFLFAHHGLSNTFCVALTIMSHLELCRAPNPKNLISFDVCSGLCWWSSGQKFQLYWRCPRHVGLVGNEPLRGFRSRAADL